MIDADATRAFDALARRLERRAVTLAAARTRSALLARRNDPLRWRRAQLLWPLFAKG